MISSFKRCVLRNHEYLQFNDVNCVTTNFCMPPAFHHFTWHRIINDKNIYISTELEFKILSRYSSFGRHIKMCSDGRSIEVYLKGKLLQTE